MRTLRLSLLTALATSAVLAQTPTDPFPQPIQATEGVIGVRVVEFATVPDVAKRPG